MDKISISPCHPFIVPSRVGYTYTKQLLEEFKKDVAIDANESHMIPYHSEDGIIIYFVLEKTAKDFKEYIENHSWL